MVDKISQDVADKINAIAHVAPPGGRTASNDADEINQSQQVCHLEKEDAQHVQSATTTAL